MIERSLNRVLRRVDWRFLLSTTQIEKSLCLSGAPQLQQSLAAVSKTCVDPKGPLTDDCEVVAAVQPGHATLLAANKALGANGMLYSEWVGWRAGGTGGIESRLGRAGFKHSRAYWVYPNSTQPQFWVPVNSSRAPLRYIAQTLRPSRGRVLGLLRGAQVELLAFLTRTGLVPHLGVISDRSALPHDDVFQVIRAEYEKAHGQREARLSFLVTSGGGQVNSKIVVLVFDDRASASPVWVVKIPRVPEDGATLEVEKSILTELRHLAGEAKPAFLVPSFLWSQTLHGVQLYVQTVLTGRPFAETLAKVEFSEAAALLTEMQVSLAQQTASSTHLRAAWETTDPFLSQWAKLAEGIVDAREIAQTQTILASLGVIPEVFAHNDFTPWNIVETREGLGIFDWSDACQKGVPLLDLLYGLTTSAFLTKTGRGPLEPVGMQRAYQELLDPETPLGRIFQASLDSYTRRVGLPPESIAPLRLMTWIKHSLYELENHRVQTGRREKLVNSVCIPLWRMELQIQSRPLENAPER